MICTPSFSIYSGSCRILQRKVFILKNRFKYLCLALCLLAAFALWTAVVCFFDVQPIGPLESHVGLSTLNACFHRLTGVHMTLYVITDWLGLLPIAFATGFALLGAAQWIKRKSLLRVDRSLFVLGGFYLSVLAVYLLFENFIVNYRPVLINACLEASYPSSTTILVLCIMPTSLMQMNERIRRACYKRLISAVIIIFTVFMVIGRLISGVHWLSDIVGGILLSAGLVMMYCFILKIK